MGEVKQLRRELTFTLDTVTHVFELVRDAETKFRSIEIVWPNGAALRAFADDEEPDEVSKNGDPADS